MKNKKLVKIIINVILLVSFLLTYFLELTGLELHQYLGIAVGIFLAVHIITHAEWIKQVSNRFYKKISGRVRFYYLMDAVLLLNIVSITITGILISTWLTIDVSLYVRIRSIHIISSISGLAFLIIKIAFHWKFFARIFRKIHLPKIGQLKVSPAAVPSRGKPAYTRRDALKTIGVITAVGALGLYKAVDAMSILKVEDLPAPEIHTSEQQKITTLNKTSRGEKIVDIIGVNQQDQMKVSWNQFLHRQRLNKFQPHFPHNLSLKNLCQLRIVQCDVRGGAASLVCAGGILTRTTISYAIWVSVYRCSMS